VLKSSENTALFKHAAHNLHFFTCAQPAVDLDLSLGLKAQSDTL
jgi:hypothetical protein